MPTIELTDEQSSELMEELLDRVVALAQQIAHADPVEKIELRHRKSVLSDILELLEIA